jgi:hypothetical protein
MKYPKEFVKLILLGFFCKNTNVLDETWEKKWRKYLGFRDMKSVRKYNTLLCVEDMEDGKRSVHLTDHQF